ncbi:hypothetical protein SAMN05444320_12234 [Streptoalloteichus hindustanus]|uniref:Uncharacterized protein n=1 Tax=Streptoalloteichus hindustanus TaxID=2017 RepID=A0A1M5Q926_STRHI|nr:hypothetical protein SAMN05444320_12234 [Streptoalloteichus hindustanus]
MARKNHEHGPRRVIDIGERDWSDRGDRAAAGSVRSGFRQTGGFASRQAGLGRSMPGRASRQRPRVKSGNGTGAPPRRIDSTLSATGALHVAES